MQNHNTVATSPLLSKSRSGFTIIELLVVIVVIAILATITIVTYNGIQDRAMETALKSDLRNAATELALLESDTGLYPSSGGVVTDGGSLTKSSGTTFQYTSDGSTYCLTATSSRSGVPAHNVSSNGSSIGDGACTGHTDTSPSGDNGGGGSSGSDDVAMQTITTANCSSTRTRVVDARDNHSYWIQKLADGKCWMLTNLAYAGGGTNTYGDTKTLTHSTSGTSYTQARYYTPAGTPFTTSPANPSTSTNGSGQSGYLYNWCAAMGGQATAACANATTPAVIATTSICPSGWRLPTGDAGEFRALNTAINGGSSTNSSVYLTQWLAQYVGWWNGSLQEQGSVALYWASTQYTAQHADNFVIENGSVIVDDYSAKTAGFSVRCIAAS